MLARFRVLGFGWFHVLGCGFSGFGRFWGSSFQGHENEKKHEKCKKGKNKKKNNEKISAKRKSETKAKASTKPPSDPSLFTLQVFCLVGNQSVTL